MRYSMFILAYIVCIDQSKMFDSYVVEQCSDKTDQNIGMHISYGSLVVMNSYN